MTRSFHPWPAWEVVLRAARHAVSFALQAYLLATTIDLPDAAQVDTARPGPDAGVALLQSALRAKPRA